MKCFFFQKISSKINSLKQTNFISKISVIDKQCFNLWHLCSGHDLIKILNLLLKHKFGDKHGKSMGYSQIEKILRTAYTYEYFKNTELIERIIINNLSSINEYDIITSKIRELFTKEVSPKT